MSAEDITLVTGGAGFIGANLVDRLAREGRRVRVLDDLSRLHVERNLRWLLERHGGRVEVRTDDVRDAEAVNEAMEGVRHVFHFAAQVAVTTSLVEPMHDFTVNGLGTLNVLEAIRRQADPPTLIYTSTNKVYGALPDVALAEDAQRYRPADPTLAAHGVSEQRPLDFHSPYGCSKGCADQYVIDYARSFTIPACVFRMSCIYGPRQFGNEDQGWVAHFWKRALAGEPITLYGDGKQVRDILFIDDLVEAFLLAEAGLQRRPSQLAGRAFNLGGGPSSTLSLIELLDRIEASIGRRPECTREGWRTGDQRYYVSDTRRFSEVTGWRVRVGVEEGLERLGRWLESIDERPVRAEEARA